MDSLKIFLIILQLVWVGAYAKGTFRSQGLESVQIGPIFKRTGKRMIWRPVGHKC